MDDSSSLLKTGAITKPVLVWQGDDDFMVPKAHSEWLVKHIPTATLNFIPGHGHISLTTAYRPEIIKQAMELLFYLSYLNYPKLLKSD